MQQHLIQNRVNLLVFPGKSFSIFFAVFIICIQVICTGAMAASLNTQNPPCADPVIADAGPPFSSVCLDKTLQLNGIAGGNFTTVTWTSSGDGTFSPNAFTLNAVYHPGATDKLDMMFTLTLTVNTNAPCVAASDAMVVLLLDLPVTITTSNSPVCEGTALDLGAGGGDYFYWTGPKDYKGYSIDTTIFPVEADQSGMYYVTITNADGCSKLDSVTVVILPASGSLGTPIVACGSATLPWGETVTVTDNYLRAYPAFNGCDSIVTVHVTINNSNAGDTTAFVCNSFTWYGHTYHSPAIVTHTFTNATGCDSIVTLHLNVGQSNTGDTTAFACTGFSWYGTTYFSTTTGMHTLTNASGCDSMVILHLTVGHPSSGDTTASFCGHFTWYGITYTTSGDKVHVIHGANAQGCDSTVTLHLNISAVDDGNACTVDACNTLTGTTTHTPVNTSDGIACTFDACNTLTGAITHTNNTPTITATANPILCFGETTCISITPSGGVSPYSYVASACGFGAGGPFYFAVTDANGCSANSNPVFISQPPKLQVDSSSPTTSCGINTGIAKVFAIGGTGTYTYQWFPGGQTTNPAVGLAPGNYSVTVKDANNCTTAAIVTIGAAATPLPPGPISGPAGACKSQSGVVYSIAPVPGASSYIWTLPAGASGSSTGTSITVNFNSVYAGGFICVKAVNACGTGSSTCLNVPVLTLKPGKTTITGPATVCVPATVTYCASSSYATSFNWIADHGLVIVSGQGTGCIVVNVPTNYQGNGVVSVTASNCIGPNETKKLYVHKTSPLINPPLFCIANSNDNFQFGVCPGSTHEYEICPLADAECYTWTAPTGATINDRNGHTGNPLTVCSGNLNDVDVTFPAGFVSGNVTVSASNSCSSTSASALFVKAAPAVPGVISGPASVCKSQTKGYTIAAVAGATSYSWAVTGGATISTGQGSTNVYVKFTTAISSSVLLTVTANACSYSTSNSKPISVTLNCREMNNADGGIPTVSSNIIAYPNPTTGHLTITFFAGSNEKFTLNVIDLVGNVLISEVNTAEEGDYKHEIDLSGVAKGMYFLRIKREGKEVQTKRIVVK